MKLKALALAALASAFGLSAEALEVRFYPDAPFYPYELDGSHSAYSLLIHNIAIINDGSGPVTVTEVQIELRKDGRVLDLRSLDATELDRAAASGSGLQQGGILKPLAFMFGGDRLLPAGANLPATAKLAPGEAILIPTQLFAWRGVRNELVVRARGDGAVRERTVPISQATSSKTVFALPLKGVWFDGAGSSLHSPHRWVPNEQFAHDLLRLGPDFRSYKGDGTKFTDYFAYNQPVIAAAAGTVVAASDAEVEDKTAMRQSGETMEKYMERLQGEQMKRILRGLPAVVGNYVMIDHGDSEFSLYAHLKPNSVKVKAGQKVEQGAVIGAVGSSGNSTEPHLHFQVCNSADPLMCAGIPPTWRGLSFTFDDFPRAPQSGDLLYDLKTPN
jgi:murein DD-endopeptidase MepM/ murein hydrolase activator NlpD